LNISIVKRELLRKSIHVLFSFLLLTIVDRSLCYSISSILNVDPDKLTTTVLSIGVILASLVNSIQIKAPQIRDKFFFTFTSVRREVLKKIRESATSIGASDFFAKLLEEINEMFDRGEKRFQDLLDIVERDYEKKFGFIAVTFALISVLVSYVLFGREAASIGVLALMIVDPTSAVITSITSSHTKTRIGKHTPLSILASFLLSSFILTVFMGIRGFVVGAVSVIVEAFSPEDNLTLPISASLTAWLLYNI